MSIARALPFVAVSALLLATLSACEQKIGRARGPASGAIVATNTTLLIAAEDHHQLFIVNLKMRATTRVDVGDSPAHVILLADGVRAAVTTRYGGTVDVVDIQEGQLTASIPVGVEPFGLTEISPGRIAVALAGDAELAIVDVDRELVERKVALADRDPRAVTRLADGSLYVTHMATGAFSRVVLDDDDSARVTRVDVTTFTGRAPRPRAEHIASITVDDDAGTVLVAHSQAHDDVVRAAIEPDKPPVPGRCGYGGCVPEEAPDPGDVDPDVALLQSDPAAVTPSVTEVDPGADAVITPARFVDEDGDGIQDCFVGCDTRPPNILDPREPRFAGKHLSNPVAVALFDDGRGQLVVNLGSRNAILLRRHLTGASSDVIGEVLLGHGAQAIAVSPDGAFAYVWNRFDVTVSKIVLPRVSEPPSGVDDADKRPRIGDVLIDLEIPDQLSQAASAGRKLFHDARDARIAAHGAISCASCHPDGRTDGRTWQFLNGPRNTPQLGGGILETAPFHWPGDVREVRDLNRMTVVPFMGGSGLDRASFEMLAAFIDGLRSAPTIEVAQSEAAARGEEIFFSEGAACATCHAGPHFTDNLSHDVGTQAPSTDVQADIAAFQTPVLHGLGRSAPYLHDGSQATLEELVDNVVRSDMMGHGSHLSDQDAADLVAFLETL